MRNSRVHSRAVGRGICWDRLQQMARLSKHVEADALLGSPDPSRLIHALRPFFAMPEIEENAPRKSTTGKKEIPLSPIAVWPTPDAYPELARKRGASRWQICDRRWRFRQRGIFAVRGLAADIAPLNVRC